MPSIPNGCQVVIHFESSLTVCVKDSIDVDTDVFIVCWTQPVFQNSRPPQDLMVEVCGLTRIGSIEVDNNMRNKLRSGARVPHTVE